MSSPDCTAMHRGIVIQRAVIHHIGPHAKRHRLVIRLVQGHEGLRLILMAAAGKRPAAAAKASAAPVPVAERQRVADIAVVRGVAGVVAAAGVGGVAADAGVVVGVAGVLAGVAQVGGESLLPRAVFIVGELGGVPAHICGLKGQYQGFAIVILLFN
jgi:hypothetical protein